MSIPCQSPNAELGQASAFKRGRSNIWRWLLLVLGLALAWHVLKGMEWTKAWDLLAGLGPQAIGGILAINLLMLPIMTARWWLLLRTLSSPLKLITACTYRCAANTVSYLTPGPHFGGEPLLVYLLHRRHGIDLTAATTSVALDRLLELLASLVVLLLCLTTLALVEGGLIDGPQPIALVLGVMAVLTLLMAATVVGGRPFSRLLSWGRGFSKLLPLLDAINQGEAMAKALFQQHRRQFLAANLYSFAHWVGVFAEFWLMAFWLGFPLNVAHLTAVVAVARLAFYTPLPAGIGALEGALPWLTATLGHGSALGLSLCLIIRCRDVLFSLAGMVLTLRYLTCRVKADTVYN